jgi:hypothetical protein
LGIEAPDIFTWHSSATYGVTPFDTISKAAGIKDISYVHGANNYKFVPLFVSSNPPCNPWCIVIDPLIYVQGPELVALNGKQGVDLNFFNENPFTFPKPKPVYHIVYDSIPDILDGSTTYCLPRTSTQMFFSGELPSRDVDRDPKDVNMVWAIYCKKKNYLNESTFEQGESI